MRCERFSEQKHLFGIETLSEDFFHGGILLEEAVMASS